MPFRYSSNRRAHNKYPLQTVEEVDFTNCLRSNIGKCLKNNSFYHARNSSVAFERMFETVMSKAKE